MPLPASVTMVTVTIDHRRADGTAPPSTVSFLPAVSCVVEGTRITVDPVDVTLVSGQASVSLAWQDDPSLVPNGWTYLVIETIDGQVTTPRSVKLPETGPVALDSLATAETVSITEVRVRSVEGITPDATGNIDLPPAAGADPAGTAATGDAAHVAASNPHSQYLTPTEGDAAYAALVHAHAQGDVSGLTAALADKESAGVAATLDAAHVAAGDPHSQYLTPGEADTLYAELAHGHGIGDVSGLQTALDGKGTKNIIRRAKIATGDTTLPNTGSGWAAVSGFEIPIPAAVGDDVELTFSAMRSANANALLDMAVIVGSTLVRFLTTGNSAPALEGDPAWYTQNSFIGHAGPRGFTVEAGDLDGSNVRFVMACKSNGTGTVFSSANYPFHWRAINRGVVS